MAARALPDGAVGVLVPYPTTGGRVLDYRAFAERAHEAGALVIAVVGEGQPYAEGQGDRSDLTLDKKDQKLVPSGSSVVAVDSVGAGNGELVMFTQGSSARLTERTREAPVDAVIIGTPSFIASDG